MYITISIKILIGDITVLGHGQRIMVDYDLIANENAFETVASTSYQASVYRRV